MGKRLKKHSNYDRYFGPATVIEAEGARVGIAQCTRCGAAVLLDPRDKLNFARIHGEWHDEREAALQQEVGDE